MKFGIIINTNDPETVWRVKIFGMKSSRFRNS
jgi:hypothetical protein